MSISETTHFYSMPSSYACSVHKVPKKALEPDINRELAGLTQTGNRALANAIIGAIWGPEALAVCESCVENDHIVKENGADADWLLTCNSANDRERVIARAEHKPKGAPPHWRGVTKDVFRSPGVLNAEFWQSQIAPECESAHTAEECKLGHFWVENRKTKVRSLAAPQVLAYACRDGFMPVTIINDKLEADVNHLYDTDSRHDFKIELDPNYFPIRTTVEFLNVLASGVAAIDFAAVERADAFESIRAISEAMWSRAGCPPGLSGEASRIVREDALLACAKGEGCEVVRWAEYPSSGETLPEGEYLREEVEAE